MEAARVNGSQLITIPFHGDQIVTFEDNGQPHVAMRRIVENLGIDWSRQRRRLEAEAEKFSCGHMSSTGSDGKRYDMLAMPVAKLPLWLATINPNKVRVDLRAKVERYQEECAVALHDYWTKGVALRDDMAGLVTNLDPSVMKAIGGMLKGIVHKALSEVVPALVEAQIGSNQYGVVHGLTAGDVLDLAGVKNRKGLRGLPRRVSDRLRRVHAENGVPVKIASLGRSTAYVFDATTVRQWLGDGGKAAIELWVTESRGQGRLKLVR